MTSEETEAALKRKSFVLDNMREHALDVSALMRWTVCACIAWGFIPSACMNIVTMRVM